MKPDIEEIKAVLQKVDELLEQNERDLKSITSLEEFQAVMAVCQKRANEAADLMRTIAPEQ